MLNVKKSQRYDDIGSGMEPLDHKSGYVFVVLRREAFTKNSVKAWNLKKKEKKSSYFTEKIGFSSPPTSFSFSKVVVLKIQLKYKNIATLHIYHPPPPLPGGGGWCYAYRKINLWSPSGFTIRGRRDCPLSRVSSAFLHFFSAFQDQMAMSPSLLFLLSIW